MVGIAWATAIGVKPIHVACHIVPKWNHHRHAILDRFAELWHAAMIKEVLGFSRAIQSLLAEIIGHDIVRAKAIIWRMNCFSSLDVILIHAIQITILRLLELGDDGEWLVRVDCVVRTRAVELLVSKKVWIEVATIPISGANVTLPFFLRATFLIPFAGNLCSSLVYWMKCQLGGKFICFPQIKLCATDACAPFANVLHWILLNWHPFWGNVGFALDPLQVTRALGITIPSAVLGPSFVCSHSFVAVRVHLNKIDCTIQTTISLRHVN